MRHLELFLVLLSVFTKASSSDREKADIERKLIKHVKEPYRTEILEDFFTRKTGEVSSNPDDVRFCLYTNPYDSDDFYELRYKDLNSVKNAPIIPQAPWKVLIHGFTQSQNSSMPGVIKNAYLEAMSKGGDTQVNVLVVDWGKLAYSSQDVLIPIYTAAVRNVEPAGNRTGEMIQFLLENGAVASISKVHIVGFSLGAHVAGNAGNYLKSQGLSLGRISGLDPAGPLFYANIPNFNGRQLTHEDAVDVDIYHTSWGSYGIAENIGDADFHPNPGFNPLLQTQPSCLNLVKTKMLLQVCSHNMAPVFYAVSILYPEIYGCSNFAILRTCDKTGQFGEFWNSNSTGNFYLDIPSSGLLLLKHL
ncbi:Hepatic triacylglycerol lipase [Orchesella cincta]|uniref:Hepatic triacylglycerol lipase n=1 Tax=Orchesella cincta TaxID=48709 RepID=A0A1D2MMT9_ORCCI|nr:Hepatic triacylglycerol lipase [Orchesella cincta]